MNFILSFLIIASSCQLIFGGVVYNPDSVCSCQGPDNTMYPCLCPQQMDQDQSRFLQAYTSDQNSFGQFIGHNDQPRSNYDPHGQYWQPEVNKYYQKYRY